MTEGTTLYCGDNCNHTGPHRYPPAAALAATPDAPLTHQWTTDERHDYEWCRVCLLVRQANGSSDAKPCKGPARIGLRAATPDAPLDVERQRFFVNWVRQWWGDSYGHTLASAANDIVVGEDFEDMTRQLAEGGIALAATLDHKEGS